MKIKNCQDFIGQYLSLCLITKKLDKELRETLNISYNDFLVLDLAVKSVHTQKQIAAALILSQAAISKIIFKLLKDKLISLSDPVGDRRSNLVNLTELGTKKHSLATNLAGEIVNNHIN
jgi:DNA-binding MarR family transcriptional regulator